MWNIVIPINTMTSAVSLRPAYEKNGAASAGIIPTYLIIQAVLKTLIIEKRLARIFPSGRKKKAMYITAFSVPIYVELAFSLSEKSVMILPTRKHQETVDNILYVLKTSRAFLRRYGDSVGFIN